MLDKNTKYAILIIVTAEKALISLHIDPSFELQFGCLENTDQF